MKYELRDATFADEIWLEGLRRRAYADLFDATWGGWDESRHARQFAESMKRGHVSILEVGGVRVGMLQVIAEGRAVEIAEIQVDPGHQGRGLGTRVPTLRATCDRARMTKMPRPIAAAGFAIIAAGCVSTPGALPPPVWYVTLDGVERPASLDAIQVDVESTGETLWVAITNELEERIVVIWNEAALVDPNGFASRLVPGTTLNMDVTRELPPQSIPVGSTGALYLFPAQGEWRSRLGCEAIGGTMRAVLPIRVGEEVEEVTIRVRLDYFEWDGERVWAGYNQILREPDRHSCGTRPAGR